MVGADEVFFEQLLSRKRKGGLSCAGRERTTGLDGFVRELWDDRVKREKPKEAWKRTKTEETWTNTGLTLFKTAFSKPLGWLLFLQVLMDTLFEEG